MGLRAVGHDSNVIADWEEAMEMAAETARRQAVQVGDFETERFYYGVLSAIAECRENSGTLPDALRESNPLERGRKRAWVFLSATRLNVEMGMDPLPAVLPGFSDDERLAAPGWIQHLDEPTPRRGAFFAYEEHPVFGWAAERDDGPEYFWDFRHIRWSDVNFVRLEPFPSASFTIAEELFDVLARSADPNLVWGTLTSSRGAATESFGFVGTATRSGSEWLEMFRAAGVKIEA